MSLRNLFIRAGAVFLLLSCGKGAQNDTGNGGDGGGGVGQLAQITLPAGFKIDYFAEDVPNAREMTLSGDGSIVYVGSMSEGKVYALPERNGDHKADTVITIAQNLEMPVGVAWRQGALYVSAVSRILRFDSIDTHLLNPPEPVVVFDGYPTDLAHGWKFIAFGPDDKLYVPVGAPCNICIPPGDIYATITRLNPDGTGLEVYARGIRNSVGFAWQPGTNVLWFTDNGRDNLGDNVPPDELNRAPRSGMNFGYPYCHGGDIPDPQYGNLHNCSEFTPPAMRLGPHVASLGMRFYTGTMFPQEYRNQIFIAEHGSWNRSIPIGYRVTMVKVSGDSALTYDVFAEGWLQGTEAWGRPVDVQVMPDGSMLVSDDRAGAIYRISYGE
jgi:glucose/arabinose dehydrogenase